MTSLNLAPKSSVVTDKTIDSQSLLLMVNDARKQCGEKEVRNNDFIARIKDELEGEHYEIFVVQKANKTTSEKVVMSIKQALRVAARESKAVRRSLVDKLEDMQAIQVPTKSTSGLTEYRLAKAEQLKAQALEKNIASARELMSMFPRLGESASGSAGSQSTRPIEVNIQFYDQTTGGQHSFAAQAVQEGNVVTVDAFLKDLDRGGPMTSGMMDRFGLSMKASGSF